MRINFFLHNSTNAIFQLYSAEFKAISLSRSWDFETLILHFSKILVEREHEVYQIFTFIIIYGLLIILTLAWGCMET